MATECIAPWVLEFSGTERADSDELGVQRGTVASIITAVTPYGFGALKELSRASPPHKVHSRYARFNSSSSHVRR